MSSTKQTTLKEKIYNFLEYFEMEPKSSYEKFTNTILSLKEEENMKEDDRPEITEWLISEDYTKGYNRAIDDILAKLKELK